MIRVAISMIQAPTGKQILHLAASGRSNNKLREAHRGRLRLSYRLLVLQLLLLLTTTTKTDSVESEKDEDCGSISGNPDSCGVHQVEKNRELHVCVTNQHLKRFKDKESPEKIRVIMLNRSIA